METKIFMKTLDDNFQPVYEKHLTTVDSYEELLEAICSLTCPDQFSMYVNWDEVDEREMEEYNYGQTSPFYIWKNQVKKKFNNI